MTNFDDMREVALNQMRAGTALYELANDLEGKVFVFLNSRPDLVPETLKIMRYNRETELKYKFASTMTSTEEEMWNRCISEFKKDEA